MRNSETKMKDAIFNELYKITDQKVLTRFFNPDLIKNIAGSACNGKSQ